jgi:hypothetical protein
MVDFKKLRESKSKPKPIHPREIFNSLPKPPGINDLYASQAEVLDAWFGRRTDRDVVIKLHTGGGKTLVAPLDGAIGDERAWRAHDLRADEPARRSSHRQEPGVRDPNGPVRARPRISERLLRREGCPRRRL